MWEKPTLIHLNEVVTEKEVWLTLLFFLNLVFIFIKVVHGCGLKGQKALQVLLEQIPKVCSTLPPSPKFAETTT